MKSAGRIYDVLKDKAPFKAAIVEETARRCVEQFGGALRAIVLTGSLARDEATFAEHPGGWGVLGDAEFLLIFHEGTPLPSPGAVHEVRAAAERGLERRGLRCTISLHAGHPRYLRGLRPHIFTYELRACGQVIAGDPEILSLVPSFAASEISREDAWRLLCNRMIEVLEAIADQARTPAPILSDLRYKILKLYLDMATSYLVFAGAYAPTYGARAEALAALSMAAGPGDKPPFPLSPFAERVTACTRFKLGASDSGDAASLQAPEGTLRVLSEAVLCTERLWRWELLHLTGLGENAPIALLAARAMRLQPLPERLRGWLVVLRAQGWHGSWISWPRWIRNIWSASPRSCVYAAASELFFQLPSLLNALNGHAHAADWARLSRLLPVAAVHSPSNDRGWLRLASAIVWNYHAFLEGTRA
jgi:hypothetical protein